MHTKQTVSVVYDVATKLPDGTLSRWRYTFKKKGKAIDLKNRVAYAYREKEICVVSIVTTTVITMEAVPCEVKTASCSASLG